MNDGTKWHTNIYVKLQKGHSDQSDTDTPHEPLIFKTKSSKHSREVHYHTIILTITMRMNTEKGWCGAGGDHYIPPFSV